MNNKRKAVKITAYVAGILAVTSAVLVGVLLIMSSLGIIFPRKQLLTVSTNDVTTTYNAKSVFGGAPFVTRGQLLDGHRIEVTAECKQTNAGEYENVPEFVILDAAGADVTDMYRINEDYGKITIKQRRLIVYSQSKEKRYDGTPLVSDTITVTGGSFVEGHTLVCDSVTSITLPGEQNILPSYSIIDENGADVTAQYTVSERLGTLFVLPVPVTIATGSAQKQYDGLPLSSNVWQHTSGELLKGHTLKVACITSETEVGDHENLADVRIYDEKGEDVTQLYEIIIEPGILAVQPLVLHVSTGSASKEYDGTPVSNKDWKIIYGALVEGENIKAVSFPQRTNAGESKNEMVFEITDINGHNITNRYKIVQDAGTLTVTPRPITIQTGSAAKKYDGTPLICKEYTITKGSLCDGDMLQVSFTSIVNIGYTENYIIDITVYGNEEGRKTDVTVNYKITYDYGTLTVTAE